MQGHAKLGGMTEHEASRTLVKSPPELWAECSDAASLARHLGEFGEITITRLDPETAVAWEGERASGTVRIEPSGWGTRVTLTAQMDAEESAEAVREAEPEAVAEAEAEPVKPEPEPVNPAVAVEAVPESVVETVPEPEPEPVEPVPVTVPPALPHGGFFARMRMRFGPRPAPVAVSEPEPQPAPPEPEPEAEPVAVAKPEPEPPAPEPEQGVDAPSVLAAALESLGQAHHRPFSRA